MFKFLILREIILFNYLSVSLIIINQIQYAILTPTNININKGFRPFLSSCLQFYYYLVYTQYSNLKTF